MITKCPGQDMRKTAPENITCPDCGYTAEIFNDEFKVKCFKCGNIILKEKLPSCLDWCKAAKECVGEKKWEQFKRR